MLVRSDFSYWSRTVASFTFVASFPVSDVDMCQRWKVTDFTAKTRRKQLFRTTPFYKAATRGRCSDFHCPEQLKDLLSMMNEKPRFILREEHREIEGEAGGAAFEALDVAVMLEFIWTQSDFNRPTFSPQKENDFRLWLGHTTRTSRLCPNVVPLRVSTISYK